MFDYIIVGAGSAGCVLANRLTADPNIRVLLLEAGPKDWNPFIHMPAGVADLLKRPWANWQFDTEPEAEMGNRRMYWPRGKCLGGSSSINGMIYIRGHQWDYEHWANDLGLKGWGFRDVLPYFKRSENFEDGENDYHGGSGELGITHPSSGMEMFKVMLEATRQAGLPQTDDFNGPQQEGAGWYQLTIKDGIRQSTANAFLKPIKHRKNLVIETRARVSRVLLEGKRAVGVEYLGRRGRVEVRAQREVLLAAGACQSPQTLMLSGIGDSETLKAAGVTPIHHLPGVGQNLQDHLDVSIQYHATKPVTLYSQNNPLVGLVTLLRYVLTRKGLAAGNGLETGAFLKTDPSLPAPDLQFHFVNAFMIDHAREIGPGHGFMLHGCQLRPESRGFVGLKDNNPESDPLIQPNYLTAQKDIEVSIKAVRIAREIFAQPAFDPYRGEEYMPGHSVQSDEDIEQFIRQKAETIYHPVGTCKMGHDELAVVDEECRVKGVEGLRVVDASVMPTLIGGNTNATTIMIAEKISDALLGKPPLPPAEIELEVPQSSSVS